MKRKRRCLVVCGVALASLVLGSTALAQDSSGPKATGGVGFFSFEERTDVSVQFTAQPDDDGGKGRVHVRNIDRATKTLLATFNGEVDCYFQNGNTARFSGEVDRLRGERNPQSRFFIIAVEDNGEGGGGVPDMIRLARRAERQDCRTSPLMDRTPVENGNLQVHPEN